MENQISKIVAFGNSYSDNGEANRISKSVKLKNPENQDVFIKPGEGLYWNNRYSNGLVSVEILADMLNVKLKNYATGGATSGRKNYTSWMDSIEETGVLAQIDKHIDSLETNALDANALYFIFPFENDYFKHADFESTNSVESVCDEALENLLIGIKTLISFGAKKFFIVECSDLTIVPYEHQMMRRESAQEFTCKINSELPNIIEKLTKEHKDIDIVLFKHTNVSKEICNSPSSFGFDNISIECQSTYPDVLPAKENPDKFYFWDEWHFSRKVHHLFGQRMYEKLISYFKEN